MATLTSRKEIIRENTASHSETELNELLVGLLDEIERYQQEIQELSIELAQLNAQLGDPALDQNSSLATQLRMRRAQKARVRNIANQNLDRAQRSAASIEYHTEIVQQGINPNSPLNLSGQRFKQGGTLQKRGNDHIAHWIEGDQFSIMSHNKDNTAPWLWQAWEDAVGDVHAALPKWASDMLFGKD